MNLAAWDKRPREEAYLFNPAFCGVLICEFIREFQKAKTQTCPYILPFCALPLALHGKTRSSFPGSTVTSLYTWRERNPDALVGFADRARSLRPVVQETIRFCIARSALAISSDGGIMAGEKPIVANRKYEDTLTPDARDCLTAARMLGRWLAKAGTTSTILAAWGIKP